MDNEKITVLVVEPQKKPYEKEIVADLASLQREVGGYIQAVYPYEEPVGLICDEEAKLKSSELNRALRDEDGHIYDVVAGTFLIAGLGEEDFCSLSPEQMEKYRREYHKAEILIGARGNEPITIKVEPKQKKSPGVPQKPPKRPER